MNYNDTDQQRLTIPDPNTYGQNPGDSIPRLYALLAVEVAPNKIVYYHLELDHTPDACVIDMERDVQPMIIDAPLSRMMAFTPWHINARLSGTVVSDRPDYRPPTRAQNLTPSAIADGR